MSQALRSQAHAVSPCVQASWTAALLLWRFTGPELVVPGGPEQRFCFLQHGSISCRHAWVSSHVIDHQLIISHTFIEAHSICSMPFLLSCVLLCPTPSALLVNRLRQTLRILVPADAHTASFAHSPNRALCLHLRLQAMPASSQQLQAVQSQLAGGLMALATQALSPPAKAPPAAAPPVPTHRPRRRSRHRRSRHSRHSRRSHGSRHAEEENRK